MPLSNEQIIKMLALAKELRNEIERHNDAMAAIYDEIRGTPYINEQMFCSWLIDMPEWKLKILRLNPDIARFINDLSSTSDQNKVFDYLKTLPEVEVRSISFNKIKNDLGISVI